MLHNSRLKVPQDCHGLTFRHSGITANPPEKFHNSAGNSDKAYSYGNKTDFKG